MNERMELTRMEGEIDRKKAEMAYLADQQKIMDREAALLNRRQRTRRLCTRGGMLERFLRHPEKLTDAEVMEILRVAFTQPAVRRWLEARFPNESSRE